MVRSKRKHDADEEIAEAYKVFFTSTELPAEIDASLDDESRETQGQGISIEMLTGVRTLARWHRRRQQHCLFLP